MNRTLIVLVMLLVANTVSPNDALSQAPDMSKYAERMQDMRADRAKGNKKPAARQRDQNREDVGRERAEATRTRRSAQPAARAKAAPEKAASFELFETKPVSLMAVLDSDGDGKLSGAEIDFATDQLLRLDANDNGEIDPGELPGSKPVVTVPTEFDAKYSGPGEQVYKTLSGFDKNGDGVLTRSEIKADYRGVFRTIDTDQNRSISPSELLEYVKTQ
jgi:Ca2+-binding EF-hand superfamily protein